MNIFASTPGKVVALSTQGGAAQAVLSVAGLGSNTVLLTGIGAQRSCNFQVQPALRDVVYLYTFGDRPGQIEVAGLAVWESCGGAESGPGSILSYYSSNRLAVRSSLVTITLGGSTGAALSGHLYEVNIDANNPEVGYAQFRLRFLAPPETTGAAGSGGFGAGASSSGRRELPTGPGNGRITMPTPRWPTRM